MAALNVNTDIASTEIYRFASLRAIGLPEKDALVRRFIKLELIPAHQQLFNADPNLLLNKIPVLKTQPGSKQSIANAVSSFFTNSPLKILSVTDLFAAGNPLNYPDFHNAYLWLRTNNSNKELKNTTGLKAELDSILTNANLLGATVAAFVGNAAGAPNNYYTRKIALWENLIAYYYSPTNFALIDEITKLIRWFWIMEKINKNDPNLANGQDIYEASNATVVFPSGISTVNTHTVVPPAAPAPAAPVPEKKEDPGKDKPKETPKEDYGHQLIRLNTAAREIVDSYKKQNLSKSLDGDCVGSKRRSENSTPELLSGRFVGSLNPNTHKTLETLNISRDMLHVPTVLHALTEEKKVVYNKLLSAQPQSKAMVLGSSVVNSLSAIADLKRYRFPTIPLFPDPMAPGKMVPATVGTNIRMGFADLRIIQTQLLKYSLGEVAHIENVLLGETKTRTFRELNRTEQTLSVDEETTTDIQKDTQSTDRYEIGQEISKMQREDMKVDAGLNVTADLGTVKINASANFSYATSKEESNKIDTRSSKEMVSRAVSRINQRKRTQSTITTLKETEDTSVHGFINVPGVDNIAGVYNWVDKYYLAQIKNYGKHLMLDFIIPEPAAFYLYSKMHKKAEGLVVDKPDLPSIPDPSDPDKFVPIKSFHDIDEVNYAPLAAKYGALVDVYPDTYIWVSTAIASPAPAKEAGDDDNSDKSSFAQIDKTLVIPDGYSTVWTGIVSSFDTAKDNPVFDGHFGDYGFDRWINNTGVTGIIPISIHAHTKEFTVNITVFCQITQRKIDEWKLKTYNAIMTGFQNKMTDYETWLKEKDVNQGVYIPGNNPDRNRDIEKEELKKACIELLTAQRFEAFDAMRDDAGTALNNYPEFSFPDVDDEGKYIQFFEQIFLWNQMTYIFFPYFWGRREKWVDLKSIEDTDPLFTKFLQAGAARVLVPLRLGLQYQAALQYFLDSGQPWNGGEAPLPNDSDKDSLWISIVDELKENMGQYETEGSAEGKPWIVKVATDLVYLHSIKAATKPALPDNSQVPAIQALLEQVEDKTMLV